MEERGCGRKDAAAIVRSSDAERHQPPPVCIPDLWHRAVGTAESQEHIAQALDPLGQRRRDRNTIPCGQDQEVEIDFDGIALVAGGLFKVSAIRQDLSFALLQEDLDPLLPPSSSFAEVRENDPCVQESQGLTGEVGVRRRVGRKIPFDMRRMDPNRIEHHLKQLGS